MANYTPSATWRDAILSIDEDTPLDGVPPPDEVQSRQLADNIKWLREYFDTTGGTSLATPDLLLRRDGNGRAKVAAPMAGDDIARLQDIAPGATTVANAVLGGHESAADPHPQYLTQAEGDGRYPLKTAADPYPQYLTQAEGDGRYPLKTAADPYPQYMTSAEVSAAVAAAAPSATSAAMALATGWSNYGSVSWGGIMAVKYPHGLVALSGMVKYSSGVGLVPDGSVIGYLPVGYRPKLVRLYGVSSAGGVCNLYLYSNGAISAYGAGAGWVSLNGIVFDVNVV